MAERTAFALACPACRTPLGVTEAGARCEGCGREYRREGGIWRFLLDTERLRKITSDREMVFRKVILLALGLWCLFDM